MFTSAEHLEPDQSCYRAFSILRNLTYAVEPPQAAALQLPAENRADDEDCRSSMIIRAAVPP
jgi:hypothetical protein